MIDRRQHLGFAPESRQAIRIDRETLWKNLECDVPIQPAVASVIHLAHSTRTNHRADFVDAELAAGTKHHRGGLNYRWLRDITLLINRSRRGGRTAEHAAASGLDHELSRRF